MSRIRQRSHMIYLRSESITKCDKMCQVTSFEEKTTFTHYSKQRLQFRKSQTGNGNKDKVNVGRIQTLENEIAGNRCE